MSALIDVDQLRTFIAIALPDDIRRRAMKVLLSGGTGFLGKHVARALSGAGHQLRLLARPTSNLAGLPEAEIVSGDVTSADAFKEAAQGCGAVVHMAALVKMWAPDSESFDAVNLGGFRNALAASEAAGARLVYTSSFIAIGPAGPEPADEARIHPMTAFRNDYERTKALADREARDAAAAGRDVVLLYPGVVYGPGEMTDANLVVQMVADHLNGRLPGVIGPGDRLWPYSYVDDVARGHEVHACTLDELMASTAAVEALFEKIPEPPRSTPVTPSRA
jgi:farnesol dehydrogenase